MKYINVIEKKDDVPICAYCGEKMKYSYSQLNEIINGD